MQRCPDTALGAGVTAINKVSNFTELKRKLDQRKSK